MYRTPQRHEGSALLSACLTIAIVAMVIGSFYKTLTPKYRSIHQSASWHEALQGAEAGANYVLSGLNSFAASGKNVEGYDWAAKDWVFANADYKVNGERALKTDLLPVLGGKSNVKVSSLSVDVYTRSSAPPYTPWFRIRSTARANLPDRFVSADGRDAVLRRMKLGHKDAAGKADPHVERTVEVIAKPLFRFANAITTESDLALGNSANWGVNSFDSSDSNKSDPGTAAGGVYPASETKRQANGSVASNKARPDSDPYGELIEGNGAVVAGDVRTNGGDDPATTTHENVSGNGGMTQSRIYDDFNQDLPLITEPDWPAATGVPGGTSTFSSTGSTATNPLRYVVNGNLGAFTVAAPSSGSSGGSASGNGNGNGNGKGNGKKDDSSGSATTDPSVMGYVEIIINGDLNIGNGGGAQIVIPPNVYATIYVDGNIDMGNGMVNSDNTSSRVASHLVIYGVSTAASPKYVASGNAVQTLAFYGPQYAITLQGTVETYGAMVGKSFSINGGGNGGFHYDEALGKSGDIIGWEVASYFDDSRADL